MKENKVSKAPAGIKPSMADRRQYHRAPVMIMEVQGKQSDRVFLAYANDISEGGLSLTTENRLRVGDRFPIELVLPDQKTVVNCTAEVVWNKEIMKGGMISQGVGVRFLDLEAGKKKAIHKMVATEETKRGKK
ncbi:MAG: PilZ domain-containing protein [Nitrospirae bacterium]|nr:PilZ domain-containing protein [Nitrospirota bacterium]